MTIRKTKPVKNPAISSHTSVIHPHLPGTNNCIVSSIIAASNPQRSTILLFMPFLAYLRQVISIPRIINSVKCIIFLIRYPLPASFELLAKLNILLIKSLSHSLILEDVPPGIRLFPHINASVISISITSTLTFPLLFLLKTLFKTFLH